MGVTDAMIIHHVGQHFSPSILRNFGVSYLFDKNVMSVLIFNCKITLIAVGSLIAVCVCIGWVLICQRKVITEGKTGWLPIFSVALLSLMLGGWVFNEKASSWVITHPPEVYFAKDLFGLSETPAPKIEEATIDLMRKGFSLSSQWGWKGKKYPLVRVSESSRVNSSSKKINEPPDILIIAVESLRAESLGFLNAADSNSLTPNLDNLAKQGVAFPNFISNGFPSDPGFFSIHTSIWPHRSKIINSDFASIQFDSLPLRLKKFGYHRMGFWGGAPNKVGQLAWGKKWYDEILTSENNKEGLHFSDAEFFQRFIKGVEEHDQKETGKPFFAYLANKGTHPSYETRGFYYATKEQKEEAAKFDTEKVENVQLRYNNVLQLVDLQIGKLVEFLKKRERWNNTVIIIVGDHSNITTELKTTHLALPIDKYVWTGGLIYGPLRLVGPTPRREEFPASQVDILPTVIEMLGDKRPFVSLGTNLFADLPAEKRTAVALRPGGVRMDRGKYSLYVDSTNPDRFWWNRAHTSQELLPGNHPESPFTPQDAAELFENIRYASYLVENDRIWDDKFFKTVGK